MQPTLITTKRHHLARFIANQLLPANLNGGTYDLRTNIFPTFKSDQTYLVSLPGYEHRIQGTPKTGKVPPNKFDFLTFDEADRLIAAAEGEWRAMITLASKTGLRQGELLALQWDDVDLVTGRLVVSRNLSRGEITTPKNGKTREIPLGDDMLAALKRHRHLRGELVFCKPDGSMFTKGECKRPLWRACKRAGLRRIGWHVLRHTFASHLVMRGAPMKAVQELMGHGTMEMTMRCAHLSPDVRKDAVRLLDRPGAQVHAHPALTSGKGEPKSA